jgi:acyl dehydratase
VADPVSTAPLSFTPADPFRWVVEEGKVREFARATSSTCAEHLRPVDPVAPVTFLTSSALWMAERNSAWRGIVRDFRNVLHGESEFVHFEPLVAGTELTVHQRVDRTYEKAGRRGGTMAFTEVLTRFSAGPTDVATMRHVSIRTSDVPPPPVPAAGSDWTPPPGAYVAPPLTVTDFVRYQGASGDFNPIHHDSAYAVAAGFPGPFAVGMLTAGITANRLSAVHGATAVRRFRVRFSAQAWPGDALSYLEEPVDGGWSVRSTVCRPDGATHLTAWAALA